MVSPLFADNICPKTRVFVDKILCSSTSLTVKGVSSTGLLINYRAFVQFAYCSASSPYLRRQMNADGNARLCAPSVWKTV